MHYLAYATSLLGVAQATYEMECVDDDDARLSALKFLEAYPTIEIWKGTRRVERLFAKTAKRPQASG
jgi:hypothetical protein